MDKTKFLERPGDSEGFTDAATFAAQYKGLSVVDGHVKVGRLKDEPWRMGEVYGNPKGWQEVEGVALPTITWAALDDEVLEETFQAWLRTSTRLENVADFRKRLRQRISDMIQRGWKCDPTTVIDLTGLS